MASASALQRIIDDSPFLSELDLTDPNQLYEFPDIAPKVALVINLYDDKYVNSPIQNDLPPIWIQNDLGSKYAMSNKQMIETIKALHYLGSGMLSEIFIIAHYEFRRVRKKLSGNSLVFNEEIKRAYKFMDINPKTPQLMTSIMHNIPYLVKYGMVDANYDTLYMGYCLACKKGNLPIIKLFIPNIVYRGRTDCYNEGFYISCANGHLHVVKYFADDLFDIHANNNMGFIRACQNGQLPVVQYFMENGADIYANNDMGFLRACQNGHLPVVQYLVEHGFNTHEIPYKIGFIWACEYGHLETVKYLVEHGATVTYSSLHGYYWINKTSIAIKEYLKSLDIPFDK